MHLVFILIFSITIETLAKIVFAMNFVDKALNFDKIILNKKRQIFMKSIADLLDDKQELFEFYEEY
ncbi:MAG: hypothetical protein A2015_08960 [Spirochaetes bacterium GWF1_31_7]|nr:MAG: hypothetical protein A2Y30_06700 [Spirochaetes bacterium GWE1_32_154]OHD48050.1 MAG: hypothetical protein A2015_08960 [Spirochaetes bacterium GWF1_31_7]OHD49633.1 MAG: hypothetical protein A2Y29_06675 [Spirochaetes bacterium GWE2_31_10]OHD81727.1 MAG: hypothetical protein A2355_07470 [Spirochaetes bacterium RIFOXYB1_FULL_32_8]HBD96185.1 hypothetical protein [Spirochaetia bacterium]